MWAEEEEVYDGLTGSVWAMGAVGVVDAFDPEEDVVEGEVPRSHLDQDTGLVPSQLVHNMHEIV